MYGVPEKEALYPAYGVEENAYELDNLQSVDAPRVKDERLQQYLKALLPIKVQLGSSTVDSLMQPSKAQYPMLVAAGKSTNDSFLQLINALELIIEHFGKFIADKSIQP